MLTYLLSNGTQANGDHFCPAEHSFKELTFLQPNRCTVHAYLDSRSLALDNGCSGVIRALRLLLELGWRVRLAY